MKFQYRATQEFEQAFAAKQEIAEKELAALITAQLATNSAQPAPTLTEGQLAVAKALRMKPEDLATPVPVAPPASTDEQRAIAKAWA